MSYIKAQYVLTGVPWIVMGDFNETLASSEHSRGTLSSANLRGMQAFQSAVATCNLTDLPSLGPTFTCPCYHRYCSNLSELLDFRCPEHTSQLLIHPVS